jgi:hypothetical protein
MRLFFPLLGMLVAAGELAGQGQYVVFARPFAGTITTLQASSVGPVVQGDGKGIRNLGQGGHVLVVSLASAVADVTGLQVRLEASFTCPNPPTCSSGDWFPISLDLTTAKFCGSPPAPAGAIGIAKANGAFPYIRVNSLTNTPGAPALAMDVRYSGFPFPIGAVSLSPSCTVDVVPTSSADKATFVICNGSPCATGTNLTNEYIVVANRSFVACYACAKTAPTGASLLIDINRSVVGGAVGSGSSIFTSPKLTIPISATCSAIATATNFAIPTVAPLERLTVDIDQIGSTIAGQDVTVTCVLN